MAEDCVRAQGAKAQQKGIDLRFQFVGDVTNVTGDPLRLRQIVANLLSNAIKFTEKGWVSVRQAVSEGADGSVSMVLDVVDTGAGIPAEKVPLIFEKFTQADSSISRKYGGTGPRAGHHEEASGTAGRTDPRGKPGWTREYVYSGNTF